MYNTLLFIHVTCFALWFGAVAASLLVVRTFQSRLTDLSRDPSDDLLLFRAYIRKETRLVDVVFIGLIISGTALAHFYMGWTTWVFVKLGLLVLQFICTIGYVFTTITKISYPCPPDVYRRWYILFGISFFFFAITLLTVFFGR
jgi:hypothetical protein